MNQIYKIFLLFCIVFYTLVLNGCTIRTHSYSIVAPVDSVEVDKYVK